MEDDRSNESEFQQTRKRRLSRVQTGDFINPSNKQNASSGNFDENLNNNSTNYKQLSTIMIILLDVISSTSDTNINTATTFANKNVSLYINFSL